MVTATDMNKVFNQTCIRQGQAQGIGILTLVYGLWTSSMDWG